MKRRLNILISIVLIIVLTLSLSLPTFAEDAATEEVKEYSNSRLKSAIAGICVQLAAEYYYGVTDEDLLYRALCSAIDEGYFDFDKAVEYMMGLLKEDKYSEFYSPERFEQLYNDITGEFFGIGVTITLSGEYVVVAGVFPDSPAEKSGIIPYDVIVSVDGTDTVGMSVSDVSSLIKREKGQRVEIGILRNGVPVSIICFCDAVDISPVNYTLMEEDKIAYINITTFSLNLKEYLDPVIKELDEKGIDKVILDIRDNTGGELTAAQILAEYFIPEGVIAKFKYKDEENNTDLVIKNGKKKAPYNMVLLVNGYSASASELFAGAVKDRDAGTIIGTQTFGKGSMQSVRNLMTGSAVKYTVAEFHSPNDTRIHTIGITPDFVVENSVEKLQEEEFSEINYKEKNNTENGEHILAIEQRLWALGYIEEADEIWNEETSEALMHFQMLNGLEINGTPDIFTLAFLDNIVYDFSIEKDDQLEAAIEYLKYGKITGKDA